MRQKSRSILDQMRADWDDRIRQAAPPADLDAWLAAGRALVTRHVAPAAEPLLGAGDRSSRRALQLGCGTGQLLPALAELFGEVHGVDISPEALNRAAPVARGREHIHLHLGDGMTLQCVRRYRFDFALAHDVLSSLPDRRLLVYVLGQMGNRLATPGLLLFQLDASGFSADDVPGLLEPARLQATAIETVDSDLWITARATA